MNDDYPFYAFHILQLMMLFIAVPVLSVYVSLGLYNFFLTILFVTITLLYFL